MILKLIIGLIFLIIGAEALVKGASKIARAVGISPLVIGLTVVAFGTSSPEMAVSVMAVSEGNSDIALGNVVGSNIFNILFILGLCALILPLIVAQQLIRLDVPVMIAASLIVMLFGFDGRLMAWEGLVMVTIGFVYTVYIIRESRKEKNKEVLKEYQEEYGKDNKGKGKIWLSVLFVIAGLAFLILGSRWLVEGAVYIAHTLGVSDLVIGLTIIAAGTSLPEVATSIIATIRGERDIAVGNVVGSNIFNILFILGISSMVGKGGIGVAESAIIFDIPVMLAVAIACLPIFFTGRKIERWEGGIFLFYYIAYTVYLILSNQTNASMDVFTSAMTWFVVPLTLLTIIIVTMREYRRTRRV
ncbi:MAG TPA: calcium/sodium antiporter [Saprospiraceae bacterium]|nr:calcium/sodium antiporter [Saprospiraceae bacterium]